MLTKKELKETYIKYTSEITEEIFDKIIKKLESIGFKRIGTYCDFSGFKKFGFLLLHPDFDIQTSVKEHHKKEIQISDILGEDWNKSKEWWEGLKKGDYVVVANSNSKNFPINYIFKVRENFIDSWIRVEKDKSGDANGYPPKNFRPATLEEIKLYEHAGKPVDVTTYKVSEENKDIKLCKNRVSGEYYYVKFKFSSKIGEIIVKWNSDVNKNQWISLHKKCYYQKSCCTSDSYSDEEIIRKATSEETQWLNVCITEDKFIEKEYALRGYDMYGKALKSDKMSKEDLLIEAKKRFPIGCTFRAICNDGTIGSEYKQDRECYLYEDDGETWIIGSANIRHPNGTWAEIVNMPDTKRLKLEVGKWYTYIERPNSLICCQNAFEERGYGIWIEDWDSSPTAYLIGTTSKWKELSDKEVTERLIKYAKEHYPVGTMFKSALKSDELYLVKTNDYYMWGELTGVVVNEPSRASIYHEGKWAEIVSKPKIEKESNQSDRSILYAPKEKPKLKLKSNKKVIISKKQVKVSNKHLI